MDVLDEDRSKDRQFALRFAVYRSHETDRFSAISFYSEDIWGMPINGSAPKQLTNFTTDQIARFDLSRDGKPNLF